MIEKISFESIQSPLNLQEIKRIDQLNLSIIERHHLRLLAHCLMTFLQIKIDKNITKNSFPSYEEQLAWCLENPQLQKDPEFIDLLLEQFAAASTLLASIADSLKIQPMDLTLDHLINNAINNAPRN
tara:strand:+ start:715 stop:1095 length:381 start_codon:yes stop_codon:yes gene_type:complete